MFGLGDPRNTLRPPTQNGHPGVGAGIGLESPGRGAPGIPSLVFLERLNGKRKTLSRWEVPYAATGVPEVLKPLLLPEPLT